MRKTTTHRFALNRQTVRELSRTALRGVAGGAMPTVTESDGCDPVTGDGGGGHTGFSLSCTLGHDCTLIPTLAQC